MQAEQVTKGDRFVRYKDVIEGDKVIGRTPAAHYVVTKVDKKDPAKFHVKNGDPSEKNAQEFPSDMEKMSKDKYEHEPERRKQEAQPAKEMKPEEPKPTPKDATSPIPRHRVRLKARTVVTLKTGVRRGIEAGRTGDAYYSQGFLWFEPNTRKDDERSPFPINDPSEIEIIGIDQDPVLLPEDEAFGEDGTTRMKME